MIYDLALAAAVLSADRKVRPGRLEKTVLLGELALDGRVRPVRGVLPAGVLGGGTTCDSCPFAPHQSCSVLTVRPWTGRRSGVIAWSS